MDETNRRILSRRKWLGVASPAAMAATLGASCMGKKRLESRPTTVPAVPLGNATTAGSDLGTRVYNIRDFGAKGDGQALDTAALQSAIDACTRDGGGTVLVPAGVFQIGTVELKSNVTLHLAASATLLGSADGKQYHAVDAIPLRGDTTLEDGNWALLFAVEARNVTIEGQGTIDGQGGQFRSSVRGTPPPSGLGGDRRPYHLLFHRCRNLTVRDIDLVRCAFHSIRVIQSKFVQLHGLHIHNRVNGNNDGFHFISCEHVAISNCTVECQDDACALFGSCKFVTVTNCAFSTRWSVFRFGGGAAENIAVSNCLLYQVTGCPIKMQGRPGDRFENISFSNLVLQDVTGPISISIGPRGRRMPPIVPGMPPFYLPEPETSADARPPAIARNISFSNIHGTVSTDPKPNPDIPLPVDFRPGEKRSCIVLNSVGDTTIENISFDDVHLTFGGGGTAEEAAQRELPQVSGEYFELGPMPAYALYARNARGLTLSNVRFQFREAELRPAVILDHVTDVAVNGLSVQGDPKAESVLRFIHTKQVLLTAARLLTPSPVFLQLEGASNEKITIDGGELSNAAAPLALKDGATKKAVTLRRS